MIKGRNLSRNLKTEYIREGMMVSLSFKMPLITFWETASAVWLGHGRGLPPAALKNLVRVAMGYTICNF